MHKNDEERQSNCRVKEERNRLAGLQPSGELFASRPRQPRPLRYPRILRYPDSIRNNEHSLYLITCPVRV